MRCTAVFDASGRFNPSFDEAHVEDIPADSVIFAIGQTSDLSFLDPADGVETRARPDQGEPRDLPDHRAGCVRLRRHRARRAAVHRRHRLGADRRALHARFPARHAHRSGGAQAVDARRLHHGGGLERDPRARIRRSLESERRAASLEIVEERYPEAEARRQASRCLRCNVNTVFDTSNAWPATAAWTSARRT